MKKNNSFANGNPVNMRVEFIFPASPHLNRAEISAIKVKMYYN